MLEMANAKGLSEKLDRRYQRKYHKHFTRAFSWPL